MNRSCYMRAVHFAAIVGLMLFAQSCRNDSCSGMRLQRPWVVLNEDRDNFLYEFVRANPTAWISREWIAKYADRYLKGPVTHYFVNPQAMTAFYPSKYFEFSWEIHDRMNGSCVTSKNSPIHDRSMAVAKQMAVVDKIDPYAIFIARARAKGVSPWLTLRVNDLHEIWHGHDSCLLSDLWRKHPEWRRVPGAQMGKARGFDMAYNYACKEVRDYHLAAFREALERYDVDGVEFDWMRFTWILPPGREREDAHFLTEFMRDAKKMVTEIGKAKKRPLGIAVRLPPRPELAREMGYDFDVWAREGLMDVVTPCNWWVSVDFAEPIAQWREILRKVNPKIRLLAGADDGFAPEGDALSRRSLTAAERNGWIARCLYEGAEGFYFFNHYGISRAADSGRMLEEKSPWTIEQFVDLPRAYPISYIDRQHYDGKIVNRQLPCDVGMKPLAFTIPCGEMPKAPSVAVVVAFESRPRDTTLATIELNGIKVDSVCLAPENFFTTRNRLGETVLRLMFPATCLRNGDSLLTIRGDGKPDARLCAGEIEISSIK